MASVCARATLLGLVLGVCACTSPASSDRADAPGTVPAEPEPEPEPPVEPATEGPKLRLKTLHFEEGALDLNILDQPYSTHAWDEGGVLSQRVELEPDYVLHVVVRIGEGETLAMEPEYRPSVTFEAMGDAPLCGRTAQRLEGHSPARTIECIEFADGSPSRPGFDPAQDVVLVGFEHQGLGATAEWSVPTSYRALYRPLEEAFFASLGCPEAI